MGKKTLSVMLLFVAFIISAQKSAVTAGGDAIGRGGSASYTIGQPTFKSASANELSNTPGVQHAYEVSVLSEKNQEISSNFEITVFPNPTMDVVNLKISNYDLQGLSYQLLSSTGQLLSKNILKEMTTPIDMDNLPSSTYFIKITQNKNTIRTFKIIKH